MGVSLAAPVSGRIGRQKVSGEAMILARKAGV